MAVLKPNNKEQMQNNQQNSPSKPKTPLVYSKVNHNDRNTKVNKTPHQRTIQTKIAQITNVHL